MDTIIDDAEKVATLLKMLRSRTTNHYVQTTVDLVVANIHEAVSLHGDGVYSAGYALAIVKDERKRLSDLTLKLRSDAQIDIAFHAIESVNHIVATLYDAQQKAELAAYEALETEKNRPITADELVTMLERTEQTGTALAKEFAEKANEWAKHAFQARVRSGMDHNAAVEATARDLRRVTALAADEGRWLFEQSAPLKVPEGGWV